VRQERLQRVSGGEQALGLPELQHCHRDDGERDQDDSADLELLPGEEGRALHEYEAGCPVCSPKDDVSRSISSPPGSRVCICLRLPPSLPVSRRNVSGDCTAEPRGWPCERRIGCRAIRRGWTPEAPAEVSRSVA